MKINKITAIIFLLLISIFSCVKDNEEFIVVENSETHSAKIVGIVLDENREPLAGATATFNGASATTDKFGVYEFENARVGDQHNFIKISRSGYFDGFRTFRTKVSGIINQHTELVKADYLYTFSTNESEEIVADKITLKFPVNSVVDDASGSSYSGTVDLSVSYIGPNDAERMPGDLSAIDEGGEFLTLTSFGMIKVSMKGAAGQKLQVKEGSTVAMTMDIPDDILSEAPVEIPMWHFDESTGLWDEQGMATKNGSEYTTELPHFSTWNCDIPNSAITISGRLINTEGSPIGSAHIAPYASDAGRGGLFNTNEDGTFSRRYHIKLRHYGID